MNKFVALAPCIYFEPYTFVEYEFGYGAFRELGIPVFGGPLFKTTDLELVCSFMSPHWCDWVKNFDGEPQPVKSREWYYQIAVEEKFQEWGKDYLRGQRETPMVSPGLDSITKVPIHLIVGTKDTHCSLDHAKRIQSEIGDAVKSLSPVEGFSHGSFESATGQDYVDLVEAQLAADDNSLPII